MLGGSRFLDPPNAVVGELLGDTVDMGGELLAVGNMVGDIVGSASCPVV